MGSHEGPCPRPGREPTASLPGPRGGSCREPSTLGLMPQAGPRSRHGPVAEEAGRPQCQGQKATACRAGPPPSPRRRGGSGGRARASTEGAAGRASRPGVTSLSSSRPWGPAGAQGPAPRPGLCPPAVARPAPALPRGPTRSGRAAPRSRSPAASWQRPPSPPGERTQAAGAPRPLPTPGPLARLGPSPRGPNPGSGRARTRRRLPPPPRPPPPPAASRRRPRRPLLSRARRPTSGPRAMTDTGSAQ